MPCVLPRAVAGLAFGLALAVPLRGAPQTAQPSPEPSPSPTIAPGTFSAGGTLEIYGIGQIYHGPGTTPVEGPQFALGSAVSPGTPYDFFSSQPITPGYAFSSLALIDGAVGAKSFDLRFEVGAQTLAGSSTGNAYWGEPPIAAVDPHLSANRFPAPIVFPTAPGSDDAALTRAAVLGGELSSKDRSIRVRAGWFEPIQTDSFVFAPIPRTDAPPALAETPAESQGNGPPVLDSWAPASTNLPLQGVDVYAARGPWSLEATDGALPEPPGTDARMTMASLVYARGEVRFSTQLLHAWSGGAAVTTTTFYGFDPMVDQVTQGPIATSQLAGQEQNILGASAAFGLAGGAAVAEYGLATYSTAIAASPGSNRPGSWYHAQYEHRTGIVDWTGDYYRFEPRYATMILPYGTTENVWAVAYSWPGPWLKGTYQLVDTSAVGINRQGFRLRGTIHGGLIEAKGVFAAYHQIEPVDLAHATSEGWVEGFYLPQFGGSPTLGFQKQFGLWLAYHPKLFDATLEAIEDTQHRAASTPLGTDAVSIRFPQWTFNLSRRVGSALLSAGLGRYGLYGNFSSASINADLSERVAWVGAQVAEGDRRQTQLTWRSYAADGIAVQLGGLPPAMHGGQFFLEQRIRLGAGS